MLGKRECFAEKVIGGEGKDAEVQKKEDAAEGDPAEQKKEHSEAREMWRKEKKPKNLGKKDLERMEGEDEAPALQKRQV